ncbi:MAG: Cys-rich protein [Leptospiraceae bacterium]|nr:Cys-rich protein [Leptospiraceae bacterium]
MSQKIILLIIVILFSTWNLSANDCIKACEKFVSCSEEMNKRKATQSERETLLQHCSKTCAKKTAQVMGCFSQGTTCNAYAQCILTQAKKK